MSTHQTAGISHNGVGAFFAIYGFVMVDRGYSVVVRWLLSPGLVLLGQFSVFALSLVFLTDWEVFWRLWAVACFLSCDPAAYLLGHKMVRGGR